MKSFFLALFGALIGSSITAGIFLTIGKEESVSLPPQVITQAEQNPFLEYYTVENAVAVSPHDIRMQMDK